MQVCKVHELSFKMQYQRPFFVTVATNATCQRRAGVRGHTLRSAEVRSEPPSAYLRAGSLWIHAGSLVVPKSTYMKVYVSAKRLPGKCDQHAWHELINVFVTAFVN